MEELFKDIIAERVYRLENTDKPELIVRLGRPLQDISGYYRCGYQLVSQDGDAEFRVAAGADAIDALMSALEMIGTTLHYRNAKDYSGQLCWLGCLPGELQLPTVEDMWKRGASGKGAN